MYDACDFMQPAVTTLQVSLSCICQDKEWAERKGRLGSAAGERPWPGATAIVALLHAGRLHVANAGDCRAVLCREVGFDHYMAFPAKLPIPDVPLRQAIALQGAVCCHHMRNNDGK